MRDIKFRVYDKYNKEMLYDAQNTYDLGCTGDNIIMEDCFGDLLENEYYEVMQYVGLKDKNSKEIYEGDILQFKGNYQDKRKFVVFYDKMKAGFFLTPTHFYDWKIEQNSYIRGDFINAKNKEVVGNIWDNPELLESEE